MKKILAYHSNQKYSTQTANNNNSAHSCSINETIKKNNISSNYEISLTPENVNINNTLSIAEKNESRIKQLSDCKYCNETKPLRSHHCTICDLCVLKMDHHCPWINNCVGQNNHRYFVLFLTHTFFGCLFVLFIGLPIIFNSSIKKTQEYNFIFVLCLAGTFLLVFFNAWNWFLIFKGYTTIEFWSNQAFVNKGKLNLNEFYMSNWKENIFLVFGTKSLFQAVFLPSIRKLPYSGLEWTKMVYPSYQLEIRDLNEEQDLNIIVGKVDGNSDSDCIYDHFNNHDNYSKANNYNKNKYLDIV